MTFFPLIEAGPSSKSKSRIKTTDIALLHKLGCKACPLATIHSNRHPNMDPTGPLDADIYVLGEAPGADEDEQNCQFVGRSGQLLRRHLPFGAKKRVRFNNVVRTRPPGNRTPEAVEIECCRPSVTADIELVKPKVIMGFGNTPLTWVTNGEYGGIQAWRGRRMPVKVGSHVCWYYPMLHPAYLLRIGHSRGEFSSEEERIFKFDIERVFNEIDTLKVPEIHTPQQALHSIECITQASDASLERIEEALEEYSKEIMIGIDYETTALRPYSSGARILSAAIGTLNRAFAIPFDHPGVTWTPKQRKRLNVLWTEFLTNTKTIKAVHNLAFEQEWTAYHFGSKVIRSGRWECTQTMASILDERSRGSKPGPQSLEFLIQQYYGFNIKKLAGVNRGDLINTPLIQVLEYNGLDARYHMALFKKQWSRLKNEGLMGAYKSKLRRIPTLIDAQIAGVPVNQKRVKQLEVKYLNRIQEAEDEIAAQPEASLYRKHRGDKFNPASSDAVIDLFSNILKRPECQVQDRKARSMEGGVRTTADAKVLDQIDLPIAKAILKYRKATKLYGTYIEPMKPGSPIIYPDGLIHAQFNALWVETQRLSCESPNLQNYPKRGRSGEVEVRSPIVGRYGQIIAIDYGQIQARAIGMLSKDSVLVKSFWDRYDIHMEWARRLAMAYPSRIGGRKFLNDKKAMKEFRTDVKNQWTFPLFFGASMQSASGYLRIPEEYIKDEYERFWSQFSGVKDWQEGLIKSYKKLGYVNGPEGHRRRGPLSMNKVINSPVQAAEADIVLGAMCDLAELAHKKDNPMLRPEINIHDDLTFLSVPEEETAEFLEEVLPVMLFPKFDWINCPITVEVSMGPNWEKLEEFSVFESDTW